MTGPVDHDDYIGAAPEHLRPLLIELRAALAAALPDAAEIISYNMPGFAIGDKIIAGYAAFSKQCGLYVSAEAIAAHVDAIAAARLKATKTGVTFAPAKPLPMDLARQLALSSRAALGI